MCKKITPKFLIIGVVAALITIALVLALVLFRPSVTVGIFGLGKESEQALRLQQLLEDNGYKVYHAETLDDLSNAECKAWVVQSTSDIFAEKILERVGDKAVFINSKPSPAQSIRYVGIRMEEAGSLMAKLLSDLPNNGDTNEDGTVSCLLLTAPEGYKEKADWERGLYAGLSENQLDYMILDTLESPLNKDAAAAATLESLSAYGRDIEVIMASSEVLATGAAEAVKQGGWEISQDLYLLTTGHTDYSMTALTERQYSGLVFANWEDQDSLLLTAIKDAINGKAPQDYLLPLRSYHNAAPIH